MRKFAPYPNLLAFESKTCIEALEASCLGDWEIGARATDTGSRLVGTVEPSEQRGTKRTTWEAAGDLACHRVQQPPQPTLARTVSSPCPK